MSARPSSRTKTPAPGGARARHKPTSVPRGPTKPRGAKPPAGRTRTAASEVQREEPRPPRQITVRTLVLAVVLLMAFVLITPTLRAYVRQQEELRELNTELAAAHEETEELEVSLRRWNNEEYIRSQARERFGFVMPGESPYRVLDPETVLGEEPELESDLVTSIPIGEGPWYLDVWESVQVAGELEP